MRLPLLEQHFCPLGVALFANGNDPSAPHVPELVGMGFLDLQLSRAHELELADAPYFMVTEYISE